jgi:hypothetical protein
LQLLSTRRTRRRRRRRRNRSRRRSRGRRRKRARRSREGRIRRSLVVRGKQKGEGRWEESPAFTQPDVWGAISGTSF